MVGFALLEWALRVVVILIALGIIVMIGLKVWQIVHRALRNDKLDDNLFK